MLSRVKVEERKTTMGDRSTDIFGPVEEGGSHEENVEKKEEEEEPEQEQEEDEDSTSSEEEREVEDDEQDYDPWNPLRIKSRGRSRRTLHERSQRFLDRGKTQGYAENAAFNTLLPVSRRIDRSLYLYTVNSTHSYASKISTNVKIKTM